MPPKANPHIYIGKISTGASETDIRREVEKFGPIINFEFRGTFVFCEFQSADDADDCVRHLNDKKFDDTRVLVQKRMGIGYDHPDDLKTVGPCFVCNEMGHFARNCRQKNRPSYETQRGHRGRRRSSSRDRQRTHGRHRSRSPRSPLRSSSWRDRAFRSPDRRSRRDSDRDHERSSRPDRRDHYRDDKRRRR